MTSLASVAGASVVALVVAGCSSYNFTSTGSSLGNFTPTTWTCVSAGGNSEVQITGTGEPSGGDLAPPGAPTTPASMTLSSANHGSGTMQVSGLDWTTDGTGSVDVTPTGATMHALEFRANGSTVQFSGSISC
jgi:hypothetical protein